MRSRICGPPPLSTANFGIHPVPTGSAVSPALWTVTVKSTVWLLNRALIVTSVFEGH